MEPKYYLIINGHKAGPYDKGQLLSNEINETDLVWFTGMKDWIPFSESGELYAEYTKSRIPDEPPPAPTDYSVPPPVPAAHVENLDIKEPARKKRIWIWISLAVMFITASVLAIVFFGYEKKEIEKVKTDNARERIENKQLKEEVKTTKKKVRKHEENNEARKREVRENIERYFTVGLTYDTEFLGGIKNLKCSFRNDSEFNVDDVSVLAIIRLQNGDIYERYIFRFGKIPAGGSKMLNAPKFDRGVSVEWDYDFLISREAGIRIGSN